MTDNEIIKALKKHSMDLCSNCKVEKIILCNNCISEMERNALDLINRQQAEIERLYIEIDDLIIAKDLLFDEAEALIKKPKPKR